MFRPPRVLPSALILALACGATAPTPLAVPWMAQPTTVTCLPTAAASVLAFHGVPVAPITLAQEVPVWPDGTSLLDVALAAERHGARALVFQAESADLRALIAAGLPPIVVTSGDNASATHALALTALTDTEARFVDPAAEIHRGDSADAVLRGHAVAGRATLLILPAGRDPSTLRLHADAVAEDHRFRAREFVKRAEAHHEPNVQALLLYQQALGHWPESSEIRNNVAKILAKLGRREEAAAELREVLRRDPSYVLAKENLHRLGFVP
jgi:hypothetical protein